MTGVLTVSYADPDAAERFCASLRNTGFAVLRDHPVPQALIEAISAEWLAFFDSDAKNAYLFDEERHDGFFPPRAAETAKGYGQRDLKEYFHIYSWGRYPAEVSDAARRYHMLAAALGAQLLSWIEAHAPEEVRKRLTMPLPQMIIDSPLTMLRILRYPPLSGQEAPGAVRAAAHADINLLTVLPATRERGLQLLDAEGRWTDLPYDPGALIVNVGDMLQEASGGYYRSTLHRVLNPTGDACHRSRISMPLFLQPRPEVPLSERYTSASYRRERLEELKGKS